MFSVLDNVLPQMVGVMIAPGNMIIVIVLLSTASGVRKVWTVAIAAFLAATLYTWGAHFLSANATGTGTPEWQGWFDLGVGVLFALLIWPQIKAALHPNPDGPKWLKSIDSFGLWQTIAVGVYIGAVNIKNLPLLLHVGLAAGTAKLTGSDLLSFAVIIGLMSVVPVLVPLLIAILSGAEGKKILATMRGFLQKHSPVIMATLFTIFAALFISKGLGVVFHP